MSQEGVAKDKRSSLHGQSGVSLIELLIVLAVISVLTGISVAFISNYTRAYRTEDQAIKIMDLMRETSQLAMNRRRIIRFELDGRPNARPDGLPEARIIDENGTDPDVLLKAIPLDPTFHVRMDAIPNSITVPSPPNFPAVPVDDIVLARFRSDGSVVDTAGLPISGTLILWPPITEPSFDSGNLNPRQETEVRALTMDGASGATRFWRYNGDNFVPVQ